jgi:hypothetical protein
MRFFRRSFVVKGRGCVPVPLREALFLIGKPSNYSTFEGIFSNGMNA